MSDSFDNTFWNGKATDIAFKSPFSEACNKARGKLLLFSSLAILNYHFPLDFNNSQFLGVRFKEGDSLSLSGLIAFLIIYFSIIVAVYTYQEIHAWWAQANSLEFAGSRRNLHDIYAHHQSISNAVTGATLQLKLHTDEVKNLRKALENTSNPSEAIEINLNRVELHKQSLENYCTHLGNENEKFGQEVERSISLHRKSFKNYRAAMFSQLFKVGFLETIFPFSIAVFAIYLSHEGLLKLLHGFIK